MLSCDMLVFCRSKFDVVVLQCALASPQQYDSAMYEAHSSRFSTSLMLPSDLGDTSKTRSGITSGTLGAVQVV